MQEELCAAAARGDVSTLRELLRQNPRIGDQPLLDLCYSPQLGADGPEFVEAARLLLEAGASAQAGFHKDGYFQNAIYGAAGRAFNPQLTRLLLDFGADPNDEETPYHAAESYDPELLRVLLDSGKFNVESLTTMLLRKADMHDHEGVRALLEHGADPNRPTRWQHTAFEQALRRDNRLDTLKLLLKHGAQPTAKALQLASERGRGDLLAHLQVEPTTPAAEFARGRKPTVLLGDFGSWLAQFAGNGNLEGVLRLLECGVPVDSQYGGDGYFGIAPGSTALHVAAWRSQPAVVEALLAHGADLHRRDGQDRSPLQLAVKACVDSYWTARRTPESVRLLLAAGASASEIALPTGYADIDCLLTGVLR